MKKRAVFLALVAFVVSLACQLFFPASREGTVIANCAETVAAFQRIQPGPVPEHLEQTGVKQVRPAGFVIASLCNPVIKYRPT